MHIKQKLCTCLQYVCNYILRCNFHKSMEMKYCNTCPFLKSIRAHMDSGSACVNCLYSCQYFTCGILSLWDIELIFEQ